MLPGELVASRILHLRASHFRRSAEGWSAVLGRVPEHHVSVVTLHGTGDVGCTVE